MRERPASDHNVVAKRVKTMAASGWRRLFRKAIPASLVVGILAVPGAGLVSAVRAARRAAHAANTI
jgi:hypothetical protein